ncbi:MAG: hypothetical protein ACLP36_04470 [Acidimicrobiales bacterium]
MSYDQEILDALAAFAPAEEPEGEGFPPLIDRPPRRVISVRDYKPKTAPTTKVNGALAVQLAEDDQATEGWRLVSHDAATGEAVFEHDPKLEQQANLRRDYDLYVQRFRHRNTYGGEGEPISPKEFLRRLITGEPLIPEAAPEPPLDPTEKRIRELEATVKRLTDLLPRVVR